MSFVRPRLISYWRDRIRSSPVGYRLARGVFWSVSGSVLARPLTILGSILVARVLGKAGFGQVGIIQSTAGVFTSFAAFGLGATSAKYVAQLRRSDPARAGRIMALAAMVAAMTGVVAAIALAGGASWLASRTLAAPHLAGELRISAILVFFVALNSAQMGALSGLEAFGTSTGTTALSALLMLPLLVIGAHLGGVRGCVWGLGASQLANWLLLHLALRRVCVAAGVPFVLRGCWSERGILHTFSLPTFLCSVLVVPTTWICNTFLVNMPGGYAEMGLYNVANQWRAAILFLPGTLNGVMLPILANLHGEKNMRSYRKVVMLNLGLAAAVTGGVAIVIGLLSPWIAAAYGRDFQDAEWTIVMMAACAVLMAVNDVAGSEMASRGAVWVGVVLCVLLSIALVLLSWWLVPAYGARGLAGAALLGYALHTCWTQTYLLLVLRGSRFEARGQVAQ